MYCANSTSSIDGKTEQGFLGMISLKSMHAWIFQIFTENSTLRQLWCCIFNVTFIFDALILTLKFCNFENYKQMNSNRDEAKMRLCTLLESEITETWDCQMVMYRSMPRTSNCHQEWLSHLLYISWYQTVMLML